MCTRKKREIRKNPGFIFENAQYRLGRRRLRRAELDCNTPQKSRFGVLVLWEYAGSIDLNESYRPQVVSSPYEVYTKSCDCFTFRYNFGLKF